VSNRNSSLGWRRRLAESNRPRKEKCGKNAHG